MTETSLLFQSEDYVVKKGKKARRRITPMTPRQKLERALRLNWCRMYPEATALLFDAMEDYFRNEPVVLPEEEMA